MSENKKMKSLKNRLMIFFILCWIVPILAFFIFISVSYQNGIIEKSEAIAVAQVDNLANYIAIRMEEIITACQRPSYEKNWEEWWKRMNNSAYKNAERIFEDKLKMDLKGKYYTNERFDAYAYYQGGGKQPLYSSRAGFNQSSFLSDIQDLVQQIIASGSNYTIIKINNGRLFVVRNLYTTENFKYFGTLALEVNTNWFFRGLDQKLLDQVVINFNDTDSSLTFSPIMEERGEVISFIQKKYSVLNVNKREQVNQQNDIYYSYQNKYPNYHMGLILVGVQEEMYSSLYDVYKIGAVLLLFFLPILFYGLHFLKREIQIPIQYLIDASKEMEEGNIGIEIKENPMPNVEFNYLSYSFNRMSAQLKFLFDKVYTEQLARKDAQIAALQAQINPHFLNNTLEMINWQARMNKDMIISKMIEALGTVLDFRMNRSNVREICLWEELRCADAYLYIMSMRYGQRLQVEQDIDKELKVIKVPPLIVQPLMENAIIHGVDLAKSGSIKVQIYHDQEYVYVNVKNTGKKLTEEEITKINDILNGKDEKLKQKTGKHTSIGIRNVNLRIKLVYGEKYGLSICQEKDGTTVSTILLPYYEIKDIENHQ
jgi:two-component system sensor histidine kinase YesM